MRYYHIILATCLLNAIVLPSAWASNDNPVYFYTLDMALKYCPEPTTGLTFKPTNPTVPNSVGMVYGNQASNNFQSTQQTTHPKTLTPDNVIVDTRFRTVTEPGGDAYGYISGNSISCFYSYPTFNDVSYALIMRN